MMGVECAGLAYLKSCPSPKTARLAQVGKVQAPRFAAGLARPQNRAALAEEVVGLVLPGFRLFPVISTGHRNTLL